MADKPATVGEALVRDIIEHPRDDGLRLIYADWCEDNGQPQRAEFIRWCLRPLEQPYAKNQRRIEEHFYRWAPLLHPRPDVLAIATIDDKGWRTCSGQPSDYFVCHWAAGFVWKVECSCFDWLAHGPRLVQREHPTERVELSDRYALVLGGGPPRYAWCRDGGRRGADVIPRLVWERLECEEEPVNGLKVYPSRETANGALSAACLAWARDVKCLECNDTRKAHRELLDAMVAGEHPDMPCPHCLDYVALSREALKGAQFDVMQAARESRP